MGTLFIYFIYYFYVLLDQKLLISGDYEGNIRVFDIGDGKISKTLKDGSKEKHEPSKVNNTFFKKK